MFSMVMMSLRICTPHPVCVGHLWVGDHGFEPTRLPDESKYQRLRKQKATAEQMLVLLADTGALAGYLAGALKVAHTR